MSVDVGPTCRDPLRGGLRPRALREGGRDGARRARRCGRRDGREERAELGELPSLDGVRWELGGHPLFASRRRSTSSSSRLESRSRFRPSTLRARERFPSCPSRTRLAPSPRRRRRDHGTNGKSTTNRAHGGPSQGGGPRRDRVRQLRDSLDLLRDEGGANATGRSRRPGSSSSRPSSWRASAASRPTWPST